MDLLAKIAARQAVVGVIGLGYVGLPLAIQFAKRGFRVLGYDRDAGKVRSVNAGRQYIKHIPASEVAAITANGGTATSDPAELPHADAILICVPTPLTKNREPDMSFIVDTADMLAKVVRRGQLVVLESTTYPGTTREILMPRLESSGLKAGRDFLLAFSPEREDPGNRVHSVHNIPKVVGGLTPACLRAAMELYGYLAPVTVPVSSLETAEATKLMENIFRCVNIALVNELKMVFARMDIDIWEVIEAASTKPFGFMPFYPGPGLGGHCIPIDPFYLTWKTREFDCATRFIELAGNINVAMPEYVISRLVEALNRHKKSLNGSAILVVGVAYKKNIDDTRESPSLKLLDHLAKGGAKIAYHDPLVPTLPKKSARKTSLASTPLTAAALRKFDAVVIATDHDDIDYRLLGAHAKLIIDSRNAMAKHGKHKATIVKA